MQAQTTAPYTVSPQLLAREDFRAACQARDFAELFRLMRKYDGASQDRISSPVEGLTQSRVSRIVRGTDHIAGLDLILRIADALRIPGAYFGLATRPWETDPAPDSPVTGTGQTEPACRRPRRPRPRRHRVNWWNGDWPSTSTSTRTVGRG